MKKMPFIRKGDLLDMGGMVGLVIKVHTRVEPQMSSQLVLDGNPVDCNAHYVATVWVDGEHTRYKFDVRFFWESKWCHVDMLSLIHI